MYQKYGFELRLALHGEGKEAGRAGTSGRISRDTFLTYCYEEHFFLAPYVSLLIVYEVYVEVVQVQTITATPMTLT